MMKLAAKLKSSTLFRYLLVGGAGYLFEMLILLLASVVLKWGDALSITSAFWSGLLFSFFFQKILAFENKDRRAKTIGLQTVLYALLVLTNYVFTLIFSAVVEPLIGLFMARTIALLITTIWNYFLYKSVIFRRRASA